MVLLQNQICIFGNRYCKDAVDSVEIVTACPTTKTEWEIAARKKNCERIASWQKCDSVGRFKYHCVINGFRNKLMEVCAPSRIIFGHCTEFNIYGGVIQNQRSTPCNDTFPKCDLVYNSLDAYKFTDCYKLVTNAEDLSTTPKYASTSSTSESTTNIKPALMEVLIIIAAVHVVLFLFFIIIVALRNYKQFPCCTFTSEPTTSSENTGSSNLLLQKA